MKDLRGRVAAITGAGSGIGRALASELVSRGCHVAISDVDEAGLAETLSRCEGRGVKVSSAVIDVSDRAAVEAWADEVVAEHGGVNIIINNAGVAMGASIEDASYEDLEWLMGINFWGVVHGTKAFLPHLREADEGHIVNLSSVFGLFAVPSQAAYNASKFAVRGFTDALRMELEIRGGNVSATTVHPGGIKTNIARNARIDPNLGTLAGGDAEAAQRDFEKLLRTAPEKAALQIVEAIVRNRRRALVGAGARVLDVVGRMPAALVQRVMIAGAKRQRR